MLLIVVLPSMIGCEKDEEPPVGPTSDFIVFANQSGQPNATANVLQAQYTDPNTGDVVDFYGNYNSSGIPDQVHTIRVQRSGSDTVVNLIINPSDNSFDKAILEVNGTRLPTMLTFDYPAGDTSMIMSFYNMNWSNGSSELIYSGEFSMTNGGLSEDPIYQARLAEIEDGGFVGLLAGVATGVAVAEVAVAVGAIGGSSLVGTGLGVVAAGVAAAGSTVVFGMAIVGAALWAMNNANASDQLPQEVPYPTGTPVPNPNPDPEPELTPLENPCLTNGVTLIVGVDPGNELVGIASGGTGGPYVFTWSTGSSYTEATFSTIIVSEPGTYNVGVVDENGCAAVGSVTVEADCSGSDLAVSISESGTTLTANPTGGNAPYSYLWSTGATGTSITAVPNQSYSVTVTDADGCDASVSSSLGCNGSDLAVTVSESGTTLTANPTGGSAPYSYLWSTGATGNSITAVPNQSYSVTVTDADGCDASASASIGCNNFNVNILSNLHTLSAWMNGGTQPYTYLWNTSETSSSISFSTGASYSVTVTDANGCTAYDSIVAGTYFPAELTLSTNYQTDITVVPSGSEQYTYTWSVQCTVGANTDIFYVYGPTVQFFDCFNYLFYTDYWLCATHPNGQSAIYVISSNSFVVGEWPTEMYAGLIDGPYESCSEGFAEYQ